MLQRSSESGAAAELPLPEAAPQLRGPCNPSPPSLRQPATGQRRQALLPPIFLCHQNSEAQESRRAICVQVMFTEMCGELPKAAQRARGRQGRAQSQGPPHAGALLHKASGLQSNGAFGTRLTEGRKVSDFVIQPCYHGLCALGS